MPKDKKKNSKKGSTNSHPYDIQAALQIASAKENTQDLSGQNGLLAELFCCDTCKKLTEHLLQCEHCALWACSTCSGISSDLLGLIGEFKNLH